MGLNHQYMAVYQEQCGKVVVLLTVNKQAKASAVYSVAMI